MNHECQFLIGKVQRTEKGKDLINERLCQFLIGKVQHENCKVIYWGIEDGESVNSS